MIMVKVSRKSRSLLSRFLIVKVEDLDLVCPLMSIIFGSILSFYMKVKHQMNLLSTQPSEFSKEKSTFFKTSMIFYYED
jgi:hypothetical protein